MRSRAKRICFVPHSERSYSASSEYMLFLVISEISSRTEDAPQHTVGSPHKQILHRYQGVIARWGNAILAQRFMPRGTFFPSMRLFPTTGGPLKRLKRFLRIFPTAKGPLLALLAHISHLPPFIGGPLKRLKRFLRISPQPKGPLLALLAHISHLPPECARGLETLAG
jgi:hypothetical protein